MAKPELRMMMTTYAPGKIGARHSHKGKPEVFFVMEGAIVDHRDGGSTEYRQGETCCVNEGAEHWMENRGTVAAVLLVAMVSEPL
jgi:quercetin dioxygenase-like cupin family protein